MKFDFSNLYGTFDDAIRFENGTLMFRDGTKINTEGSPWRTTKVEGSRFYDDKTLDYLLKDLIKDKAKEAEKELKKEVEKSKRKAINRFTNSIRNVYFNDPYTVVIWNDGSKSVVKCQEGDEYDKEKGFALAILKHLCGDTNYFNTIFKKWITEDEE